MSASDRFSSYDHRDTAILRLEHALAAPERGDRHATLLEAYVEAPRWARDVLFTVVAERLVYGTNAVTAPASPRPTEASAREAANSPKVLARARDFLAHLRTRGR